MAKKEKLSLEQRIDLWKSLGRGIIELSKSHKSIGYGLSSLGLLFLGKTKILSCGVVGTLQGVNTYLAISDVVEEGDSGMFGIGGMGETIAKGAASISIGALWGFECEQGRQKYGSGNQESPTSPKMPVKEYIEEKIPWWPGKYYQEGVEAVLGV